MSAVLTSALRVALVAGMVALAGCSPKSAPPTSFQPISFAQYLPFRLNVGTVEVVQAYRSPNAAPNAEHLFPVPPAQMAENWARQRLQAVGSQGRARYTIKQASVKEVGLPRTPGLRGAFTNDQAYRYDALLVVELEIFNARGVREGFVSAQVEQHQTVAEDASVADRERAWYLMTERMARDLNAELDRNIHSSLTRFVNF